MEATPDVNFVSRGEVRLAEVKVLLSGAGHQVTFADGALVVDGSVSLRKEAGQLLLEGRYGTTYRRVRELVHGQINSI